MLNSELKEIFINAPVAKSYIEVFELKADWFSKNYFLQNKVTDYLTVTLETDVDVDVEYVPMKIDESSSNADLDNSRGIVMQYVNDLIATELDNFDPLVDLKPKLVSRGYTIYRDGSVSAIQYGPVQLNIDDLTRTEDGTSFQASSLKTNNSSTGEIATIQRAPMLRGFS